MYAIFILRKEQKVWSESKLLTQILASFVYADFFISLIGVKFFTDQIRSDCLVGCDHALDHLYTGIYASRLIRKPVKPTISPQGRGFPSLTTRFQLVLPVDSQNVTKNLMGHRMRAAGPQICQINR